jgi:hypothetical protein
MVTVFVMLWMRMGFGPPSGVQPTFTTLDSRRE